MIEIVDVYKSFESLDVLRGVNLKIETGESCAIIGRSGCGKSVLLKIIVGLFSPEKGFVKIDGQNLNELKQKELYKIRRKFGFLFQGAALFDSMTVEENIALPLIENGYNLTPKEISKKVAEKLEMVELPNTENLKPAELSGGMKKRVGLARALITDPAYILYDEPTTGLDPIMSDSIDALIKELNHNLNVTSIIVTHDMLSVKNVSEKISMLHNGIIYYNGTMDEFINSKDEVITNFIKRNGL